MNTNDIVQLVQNDNIHAFYVCGQWRKLRRDILAEDKHECQCCKARGKYTRATHVHHVKHLREYPALALSKTYRDGQGYEHRQLISVCQECHETVCHPERMQRTQNAKPITAERWD